MNKINLKNYKKFEKQIILKEVGLNGQQKIFSSKIAIVGLGGLGCWAGCIENLDILGESLGL